MIGCEVDDRRRPKMSQPAAGSGANGEPDGTRAHGWVEMSPRSIFDPSFRAFILFRRAGRCHGAAAQPGLALTHSEQANEARRTVHGLRFAAFSHAGPPRQAIMGSDLGIGSWDRMLGSDVGAGSWDRISGSDLGIGSASAPASTIQSGVSPLLAAAASAASPIRREAPCSEQGGPIRSRQSILTRPSSAVLGPRRAWSGQASQRSLNPKP